MSEKLEDNTWYWMSLDSEGDVFYPVYSVDGTNLKVDGFNETVSNLAGATFDKAVMPNTND